MPLNNHAGSAMEAVYKALIESYEEEKAVLE